MSADLDLPMVIEDCALPALEVARRRLDQARMDVAGLSGLMPPADVVTRAAAVAELQAAEFSLARIEAEDRAGLIGNPGGES